MAQYAGLGLNAANLFIDRHFENIPNRHFNKIPDTVIFPQQTFRKYRRRRKQAANRRTSEDSQPNTGDRSGAEPDRRFHDDDSEAESSYSDGVYSAPNRGVRRHHEQRAYPHPQETQRPSNGYNDPSHAPPHHDPNYAAQHRNRYIATDDPYPPPSPSTRNANPNYPYQQPYHDEYPHRTYSPPRSPPRRSRSQNTHSRKSRERDYRPTNKRRSSSTGPTIGLSNTFSTSDKGVGIGSLGALAGGFVTQEMAFRSGKGDPRLMTLLGAALGGLGANVLEGRHERKKEEREREREREKERGRDRERERGRDERRRN